MGEAVCSKVRLKTYNHDPMKFTFNTEGVKLSNLSDTDEPLTLSDLIK